VKGEGPRGVLVREVGPRDGFQSLDRVVTTDVKIEVIGRLVRAGCTHVQAASFVSPKRVPQMADAAELFHVLPKTPGVTLSALVLNLGGMARAVEAGVGLVEASVSASGEHGLANAGMDLARGLDEMDRMAASARKAGVALWASLQCAFGHRVAGDVSAGAVGEISRRLVDTGAEVLVLADTAALADPEAVGRVVEAVAPAWEPDRLLLHFHDSRGRAMDNLLSGLSAGVPRYDASFGGLGGCPFLPHAPGNLDTAAVVKLLESQGHETGINPEEVKACAQWFAENRR